MIYNIAAFFACLVILSVIGIAGGGMPKTWVQFTVMIVCFGIANAMRTDRRHSAKGTPQSKPLISTSVATAPRTPTETAPAVKPAIQTQAGSLVAGQLVEGRLMITDLELQAIIKNHTVYANVVRLTIPPSVATVGNPGGAWYLVASPSSGVLFNDSGSEIWSVSPDGLALKRHAVSDNIIGLHVRSVDGREETVNFDWTRTSSQSCVLAWMSDSYEKFKAQAPSKTVLWGLLSRELAENHSPDSFLRWELPYRSAREGLDQVCQDPETLKTFARNFTLTPTLIKLGIPEGHPIFSALTDASIDAPIRRKKTLGFLGAFLFLFVGNVLALGWYGFDQVEGRTALIWVSACTLFGIVILAWGFRKSSLKKNVTVS